MVTEHPRCFEREQDILDPFHYLGLLEQRPGAFDHAISIRQWRQNWSADYEELLHVLRKNKPNGSGIREFIAILKLHRTNPPETVNRAVQQALKLGAAHFDGVQLCLRQLGSPEKIPPSLSLAHPKLTSVANQPVRLEQYNQLLEVRS